VAGCFDFVPNGWQRNALLSRPMSGGTMLGFFTQWLAAQCFDFAPDVWWHDALILRPMAGGAIL
jgi:hypothetical protein